MSLEAILATWKLPKTYVTPNEKFVLLACAELADEADEYRISINKLCLYTNLEKEIIIETLKSLIAKRLVKKIGSSDCEPIIKLMYASQFITSSSEGY